MMITETVERECCHPSLDLKTYHGRLPTIYPKGGFKFCQHCGQLFVWDRQPGEMDHNWEKVLFDEWTI